MPPKPSRRDRRRGGHPEASVRRPRPAPPVNVRRVTEPDVEQPADSEQQEHQSAPSGVEPASAAPRRQPQAVTTTTVRPGAVRRAATPGIRAERRAAMASVRAMEAQREQRVRRDAIRDLRRIGIATGISLAALVVAVIIIP